MSRKCVIAAMLGAKYTLPAPNLLASFETLTGYSVAAGCTQALNSTWKVQGSNSIQLTGPASNAATYIAKDIGTQTVDNFGTVVAAWHNEDDTNLNSINLYFFKTGNGAINGQASISQTAGTFRKGLRWISANVSESTFAGIMGQGAIGVTARVLQGQNAGGVTIGSWDALCSNAAGRPTIVMTFDDGYDTQYSNAYPAMASRGFLGTFYCPKDKIGVGGSLTLANLQTLYAAGWDIGCDSTTDDSVTNTADTNAALGNTGAIGINFNRQYLIDNNMPRAKDFFCWTNGVWNEATAAAFQGAGYKMGRTTASGTQYTRFGFGDIAMTFPGQSTSMTLGANAAAVLTILKAKVDEAVVRGNTLEFYFHGVYDGATSIHCDLSGVFIPLLDYIKTYRDNNQLDVLTVSQLWNRDNAAVFPL